MSYLNIVFKLIYFYPFFLIASKVCNIFFKKLYFKAYIFRIGALTSKPFAFKARAWELNTFYIADLTTLLTLKIRVDLKGLEILRILPWFDLNSYHHWLSDKIRFSYDGFSLN
jgi:hypothetical protein